MKGWHLRLLDFRSEKNSVGTANTKPRRICIGHEISIKSLPANKVGGGGSNWSLLKTTCHS